MPAMPAHRPSHPPCPPPCPADPGRDRPAAAPAPGVVGRDWRSPPAWRCLVAGARGSGRRRTAADGAVTARAKAAAHSALEGAQGLANRALSLLGVKYKFGGSTPDTGLDCSGLVQYVFQQVTGVTLPRTAKEMSQLGDKVAMDELAPGDLVFFNTRRFAFSHVGIYLGDNRFIHAPRRGREVEIAEIDRQLLAGAVRRRTPAGRQRAGTAAVADRRGLRLAAASAPSAGWRRTATERPGRAARRSTDGAVNRGRLPSAGVPPVRCRRCQREASAVAPRRCDG